MISVITAKFAYIFKVGKNYVTEICNDQWRVGGEGLREFHWARPGADTGDGGGVKSPSFSPKVTMENI